jgi:hypothetical protein
MNEANYVSLKAAQDLVAAGIVLETDMYWVVYHNTGNSQLVNREDAIVKELLGIADVVPAPSFAEIWREMPSIITSDEMEYILDVAKIGNIASASYGHLGICESENPADTLAELKIWLEGEKG